MRQQKIQNIRRPTPKIKNTKTGLLRNKLAFTLVELIVTITILSILGTIAFIALQGYSTSARDSTRVSDISSMRSNLELFQLDSGKYPIATNGVNITYSGAIVWNQGIFGESVFKNVDKLDKIPLDPITQREYTYSTTEKRNEYQLGGIMEGDENAVSFPLTRGELRGVLAAETTTTATAYIVGTYNGMLTKTNTGETCRVLSIPSIITNDTTVTNLETIVQNESFVYRGYKNLPGSFKGSRFKFDGGFGFKTNNLLVYTDTGSCTTLTDTNSYTARVNLLKGLQDAYSGTILKNEGEIGKILSLKIDINNLSSNVINYAGNLVNNTFEGNISNIKSNPIIGLCGTDNGKNFTTTLPTSLCTSGTSTSLIDNGTGSTITWICSGSDGGNSANCSANHIYPAVYENAGPWDLDTTTTTQYNLNIQEVTDWTVSVDVNLTNKVDGYILGISQYANQNPHLWHYGIALNNNGDLVLAQRYNSSNFDIYPIYTFLPAASVPDNFNLTVELENVGGYVDKWKIYVAINGVFLSTYNYQNIDYGSVNSYPDLHAHFGNQFQIGTPNGIFSYFQIAGTASNLKIWKGQRIHGGVNF